jgi:hypothetical protein
VAQVLQNNAAGVLSAAVDAAVKSLPLVSLVGWPLLTGGDYHLATLIGLNANGAEATWEIVKVTGRSGSSLTVERGQEGIAARAWPAGTVLQMRLTAASVATPSLVDAVRLALEQLISQKVSTEAGKGLMATTDKAKLDGVAAGATVDWSSKAIPGTSDLNSYQGEGAYFCAANVTAATLLNCPTSNAFGMRVWKAAGVIQEITEYMASSNRKTFQRAFYSNTWGAWSRIYTEIDPPPTATAAAAGLMASADKIKLDGLQDALDSKLPATGAVSLNGGQLSGFRNVVINGAMAIAQRPRTVVAVADNTVRSYSCDMFFAQRGGGFGSLNSSSPAEAPSVPGLNYSYKLEAVQQMGAVAGQLALLRYCMEGFDAARLRQKDAVISFWARSSRSGNHGFSLRNGAQNFCRASIYNVTAPNTWQRVSIPVPGGLPNNASWSYDSSIGLDMIWVGALGSNYRTAIENQFVAGSYLASTSAIDVLQNPGDYLQIAGVQVETGLSPSEFECRGPGVELPLCMRYFERSGNLVAPYSCYVALAAASFYYWHPFSVMKRVQPTITAYNYANGGSAVFPVAAPSSIYSSLSGARIGTPASSGSGTGYYHCEIDASAELY